MRDPRMAELAFLAELEARDQMDLPLSDNHPNSKTYGLSMKHFKAMLYHMLFEDVIEGPFDFLSGLGGFGKVVPISEHQSDKLMHNLAKLGGGGPYNVRMNHKGRLRLWSLRDELQINRRHEKFGQLYSGEYWERDWEIAWLFLPANGQISLLFADLDHFKDVNDKCGHNNGDEAIKEYFRIVNGLIPDGSTAYSIGGDEVLVLLVNIDSDKAKVIAENIRAKIEKTFAELDILKSLTPKPTVSIGVKTFKSRGDAKAAKAEVDALMYKAKEGGRNRLCSE